MSREKHLEQQQQLNGLSYLMENMTFYCGETNSSNKVLHCSFCNKDGHKISCCWKKKSESKKLKSTFQCQFCGRDGHTEDRCYQKNRLEKKASKMTSFKH